MKPWLRAQHPRGRVDHIVEDFEGAKSAPGIVKITPLCFNARPWLMEAGGLKLSDHPVDRPVCKRCFDRLERFATMHAELVAKYRAGAR